MKLKDVVAPLLSREERDLLVGSFDVVGDIAIIIIAPELSAKENLIAEAVFKINKNVRTVAKRAGNHEGEYRTIPLEVIGGEPIGEVEHRENGVRFFLDPAKVYFSVRSGNERKRISGLVDSGEEVLVMFSGIGAYPLIIAANSKASEIVGIEKNPDAHSFAAKSLRANRRISNVTLYQGDVARVLPRLRRTFDRVLMPLPSTAEDYLDCALAALRPGGRLHFYDFQTRDDFFLSVAKLQQACTGKSRFLQQSEVVVCGHVSPRTFRICVDALIQ
jgi:tRNA (guanine37-N1)-methyltransferase